MFTAICTQYIIYIMYKVQGFFNIKNPALSWLLFEKKNDYMLKFKYRNNNTFLQNRFHKIK